MAFKSKVSADISNSAGAATTITDTVGASVTHTLIGLSFANTTAANVTVTALVNKNGGGSAHLVKGALVLPGGALVAIGGDQKVVLETGDTVTAYADTATAVDVVLSYLEG